MTDREYRGKVFEGVSGDTLMNCVAGGIIFFIGDALAQYLECKTEEVPSATTSSSHFVDADAIKTPSTLLSIPSSSTSSGIHTGNEKEKEGGLYDASDDCYNNYNYNNENSFLGGDVANRITMGHNDFNDFLHTEDIPSTNRPTANNLLYFFTQSPYNYSRSVAMAFQGILLNGVLLTPFYRLLDGIFGDTHKVKRNWPAIPLKVISLQLIYMPISTALFVFLTPVFHHILNTGVIIDSGGHEPQNLSEAVSLGKARTYLSFMEVYIASWWFWPLSDFFNFRYIPVSYRPIWDSLVDIVWTSFLSFVCHSNPDLPNISSPLSSSSPHPVKSNEFIDKPSFWRKLRLFATSSSPELTD